MLKKILIVLGIVLVLFIGFVGFRHFSIDNKEIAITDSLITRQQDLEKDYQAKGYSLDNPKVVVNPYDISPLTALVMFETDKSEKVTVTVRGKDTLSTFTKTFEETKEHYIPVYGLYPDEENTVILEVGNKQKELKIKTEKLPEDFILPTKVTKEEDKLTNDLYFLTPSSTGYTCAYDVNGDVRWYLTTNALWKIDRLENGHLMISTERLVNSPYYMTGLYEMDMFGKIYKEYSLEGGYHHDYYEMKNGNLLVASDNFNSGDGTVEDYIVEVNKNGKIVKHWDLKDILNMKDGQSENWVAYDWFHNNSVWYDEKTNSITLSGRHQDAVINIDYDSGKLNWIIGDSTNWSKEYQKYFFKPVGDLEWQWSQHAAMITPEGYVFIFDNGNNKSKKKKEYVKAEDSYSRGVMYKIDTDNMTIEQVYEYGKERGSDYYSPYISDVDYLAKNHYIIHSGGISYTDGKINNQPAGLANADKLKSITTELLNDEVIYEIELPTNNYRVEKMSMYPKENDFALGKAEKVGSLGTTEKDSKIGVPLFYKDAKDYKNHDIKLEKEEDRLVVSGRFKRGTDVNILLYKDFNILKYDLPVSKKPYTALCVDVFTEEENKNGIVVTKYINDESLKGKYSIFIEIDGTLYNTDKSVEF